VIRQRLSGSKIPEAVVRALIDRDAALWVGEAFDADDLGIQRLGALIGLPWGKVLCESKSARLAKVRVLAAAVQNLSARCLAG
jgi:hypothetical protein